MLDRKILCYLSLRHPVSLLNKQFNLQISSVPCSVVLLWPLQPSLLCVKSTRVSILNITCCYKLRLFMCGVQRVPPIIFLNNWKYNAGLLKGLSPHTHTHFLFISWRAVCMRNTFMLNKNCCDTFAECASLKKMSLKFVKEVLCQQCHVKEYMQNSGANNRLIAEQVESTTVCCNWTKIWRYWSSNGSKPEKCVFRLAVQNRTSKHRLPGKQNFQKYAHIN